MTNTHTVGYRRNAPLRGNTIAPLSTLRPDIWEKPILGPSPCHSDTAMDAARLLSEIALSPATRERDLLLDRVSEMCEDERDELAYASELS